MSLCGANTSYREDQVKSKSVYCLFVMMLWVTFGFPGGVKQIAQCSMQLFWCSLCQRCRACKSLSHKSWMNCQNVKHSFSEVSSHTFCCLSSSLEIKLLIHLWLLRFRRGMQEPFYYLLRPLTVQQKCPASQLRPSSSSEQLKSLWQIAESKDLEKSGSQSCVFVLVSLSQTNTNSLLNSVASLAFHFPFGKLD